MIIIIYYLFTLTPVIIDTLIFTILYCIIFFSPCFSVIFFCLSPPFFSLKILFHLLENTRLFLQIYHISYTIYHISYIISIFPWALLVRILLAVYSYDYSVDFMQINPGDFMQISLARLQVNGKQRSRGAGLIFFAAFMGYMRQSKIQLKSSK